MHRRSLSAVILLLMVSGVWGAGRPDIIDVIYISRWSCYRNRFDKMVDADPSVDVFGVPMPGTFSIGKGYIDAEDLNRRMRIYMPRTLDQLVGERDVIVMHDAPQGHFEVKEVYFDPKWISWFVDSVQKNGTSFAMWGGDASWGGGGEGDYPSWGDTILDAILPFRCRWGYNVLDRLTRVFRDPEDPLSRIPWKEAPPIEHVNMVDFKPGATPVAEAVSKDASYPWIAEWKSGKGRVIGETEIFGSEGTSHTHDVMRRLWHWYQDFLIYMVYRSVEKPIPSDVYLAHRLRQEVNLYIAETSLMVSLLEFIDGFGADTRKLYDQLREIDGLEKAAEEHYRRDEYTEASSLFDQIEAQWVQLDQDAIEAKEQALTWVFVIEWFAVSGTALVAGVTLWMLMVGRRAYRDVGITRAY